MKRKDFWKGFGVALALVVVLNLAWKPICRTAKDRQGVGSNSL